MQNARVWELCRLFIQNILAVQLTMAAKKTQEVFSRQNLELINNT